jgi:hypothetical protein
MQRFFTPQDAVELYQHIRDQSGRSEEEWRPLFIAYFPAAENLLPPVELNEEEIDEWLDEADED